jgi:hypothetical protein
MRRRESLENGTTFSPRVPGTNRPSIHASKAVVTRIWKFLGCDFILKEGEWKIEGRHGGVAMTVSYRKPHATELADEGSKKIGGSIIMTSH